MKQLVYEYRIVKALKQLDYMLFYFHKYDCPHSKETFTDPFVFTVKELSLMLDKLGLFEKIRHLQYIWPGITADCVEFHL